MRVAPKSEPRHDFCSPRDMTQNLRPLAGYPKLPAWVDPVARHAGAGRAHLCDCGEAERRAIELEMVSSSLPALPKRFCTPDLPATKPISAKAVLGSRRRVHGASSRIAKFARLSPRELREISAQPAPTRLET